MTPPLGIIEGFYGPLWQWREREALVRTLAPAGYGCYLYAPKGDAFLRKRWQEPHPESTATAIRAFGHVCRQHGMAFGVGLSPYELFNDFNADSQQALAQKLDALDALDIDWLAILFDDMHSQRPDLAAEQGRIMQWVQAHSRATRLLMCPTYYSDDPVLDRVFGQRPANYLEELGQALPTGVDVFWTGEEVCAREISPGHLRRVARQLGRKPVLWDNYPVNDGDRMSRHLHLRGFTGRPASNADWLNGHAINPALQPTLTAMPALTLVQSYQQGEDYQYGQSFLHAAEQTLGTELARQLQADLLLLQDSDLHRLSDERKARLHATYAGFDHPAAREIQAWLAGDYQVTDEMVQTQ